MQKDGVALLLETVIEMDKTVVAVDGHVVKRAMIAVILIASLAFLGFGFTLACQHAVFGKFILFAITFGPEKVDE